MRLTKGKLTEREIYKQRVRNIAKKREKRDRVRETKIVRQSRECVCVCVCERERDENREAESETHKGEIG